MTPIRRFLADWVGSYRDGARVAMGLPWLFGGIILWEFAQHVIEYRIGFFDSRAAAKAVALDQGRMVLGWVKMILVYVGGFFAIRYCVAGGAPGVTRPRLATLRRYLPYIVYSLILFALIFYAGILVPEAGVQTFRGIVGIGQLLIEPLLMAWIVSAATDGPVRNPVQSARAIGWLYGRGLLLFFLVRTPIGALHQFLGTWGIGKSTALLWPMLALDAIVVGLLIAVIPAAYVRIATHAATRSSRRPAGAAAFASS